MSTFPPELLLEIFSRVCEPPRGSLDSVEHAWTQSKSNINNPSPFLLGKICRAWRELAWSTPQLWTYIHLVILPGNYRTQAQLLDDYLRRSKQFPLAVVVRIKERDEWHIHRSIKDVLPLYIAIGRESSRWISMDMDFPARLFHLLKGIRLPPSLRRMSMNNKSEEMPPEVTFPALKLQELSVKGSSFSTSQTPHLYLTHLRASSTNAEGLRALFKNAPYLRWCSLDDILPSWSHTTWNSNPAVTEMPIRMKHLETFIIRDSSTREVQKLLSSIKFSRPFREFRSTAIGLTLTQELLNIIVGRLSPSICSLQTLELGPEWVSSITNINAGLGSLLGLKRSLTTLILNFNRLTFLDSAHITAIADLLDPVWPPEPPSESSSFENRVLVPKLQHIELHMDDNEGPSILPILTVLRHRWMFGSSVYSDSSSSKHTGPVSTSKCAKIISVRLPETYRWEASEFLHDAIQEGMLVEFGGNQKLLGLKDFLCE